MIVAVLAAAAAVLAGVGVSLLAKRAGPRRWDAAQAAASFARVGIALAGVWVVWKLTGRGGAVAVYVFLAAVGQMAALITLLNKNKLS